MLQHQQPDRDQREHKHYRMNFFAASDYQIKANVRNEAPEYSLGDREGKGDEDYSQKCRKTFFNFSKINLSDAAKHRCAHQNQHGSSRSQRDHTDERRQKETRQKAERSEN